MNKKVALILSGSGHVDGAEITEAVSLNICLIKNGFEVSFFAPDRDQMDTVNHLTGSEMQEKRNILVEAARISRGKIKPLEALDVSQYEAIVFAGGFGVVKNFTDLLTAGDNARLSPDVARILLDGLKQKKVLVGICAAPLLLAMAVKEFGKTGQQVTFGSRANSEDFLSVLEPWGCVHVETPIQKAHIDGQFKLITSGAYMYPDANAAEIFDSAQAAVDGVCELLN